LPDESPAVPAGGLAYNYTITSLHNRLRNLLSVHFRKERRATRRALHEQPIEEEWMGSSV
jgi:hypothetical protein